jgi:hypothetical protein
MVLSAAGFALALAGLARGGPIGIAGAVAGTGLAYRGLTGAGVLQRLIDPARARGPFPAVPDGAPIRVPSDGMIRRSTTVARTADAMDALIRDPGAVAAILDTSGTLPWTADAETADGGSLRWRLALPLGRTADVPLDAGALGSSSIAWRIADGPAKGGTLRLSWRERPGSGETEVEAALALEGDGGPVGLGPVRTLARAALAGILRRVAALVETGTIPRVEGQTSGRKPSGEDSGAGERPASTTPSIMPAWAGSSARSASPVATTPTSGEEVRA